MSEPNYPDTKQEDLQEQSNLQKTYGVSIGHSVDEKQSWVRKLPGFRSNKTWKKAIAVFGYIFIGLAIIGSFSSDKESPKGTNYSVNSPPPQKVDNSKESAESFQKGNDAFQAKDYDTASLYLNKVIATDPNYLNAKGMLNTIQSSKLLSSAKTKLNNNDYSGAKNDLKNSLNYNSANNEASDLLSQVEAKEKQYLEEKRKQEKADFINSCQTYEYRVLNKNPDALKGNRIKTRGKIMQIQESGNSTFILLETTNNGYDIWTDNVAVLYEGKIDVYENDKITLWGEITGSFSYESVARYNITVPAVRAKYIEKGLR
ncbi:hypothetical protein GTO91_03140 [Heliobacterium undosum]|uniref:Tetratricopeptide repeat protein n=1 Tax=Heliomicrobium undosum TaxID=121734 RepID=A0A845L1N7_9FIRM|nr:hypothetical protein [Heliomicrobium undosum]MZP28714.1 hypothetical protein [Heliomicrobium undosum]